MRALRVADVLRPVRRHGAPLSPLVDQVVLEGRRGGALHLPAAHARDGGALHRAHLVEALRELLAGRSPELVGGAGWHVRQLGGEDLWEAEAEGGVCTLCSEALAEELVRRSCAYSLGVLTHGPVLAEIDRGLSEVEEVLAARRSDELHLAQMTWSWARGRLDRLEGVVGESGWLGSHREALLSWHTRVASALLGRSQAAAPQLWPESVPEGCGVQERVLVRCREAPRQRGESLLAWGALNAAHPRSVDGEGGVVLLVSPHTPLPPELAEITPVQTSCSAAEAREALVLAGVLHRESKIPHVDAVQVALDTLTQAQGEEAGDGGS